MFLPRFFHRIVRQFSHQEIRLPILGPIFLQTDANTYNQTLEMFAGSWMPSIVERLTAAQLWKELQRMAYVLDTSSLALRITAVALWSLLGSLVLVQAQTLPWADKSLAAGKRAELLVRAMTIDQKIQQLR